MKYHWFNITTGIVAVNFWQMIKLEISDMWHFHIIGIWKYSKEGF